MKKKERKTKKLIFHQKIKIIKVKFKSCSLKTVSTDVTFCRMLQRLQILMFDIKPSKICIRNLGKLHNSLSANPTKWLC